MGASLQFIRDRTNTDVGLPDENNFTAVLGQSSWTNDWNYNFDNGTGNMSSRQNILSQNSLPTRNLIETFTYDSTCRSISNTSGIENIENNGFGLGQNIPNPAGNETQIPYSLPEKGKAVFTVTDIMGRILYAETIESEAGSYMLRLDLEQFGSGLYYYSLEYKGQRLVRKMVVAK